MSNPETANIYQSIIEDVIAESRQDFEDSGIDEATLQDLRKIWMQKLAQSKVADFPWVNAKEDNGQLPPQASPGASQGSAGNFSLDHADSNTNGTNNNSSSLQINLNHPEPTISPDVAAALQYPSAISSSAGNQEDTGLILPGGGRVVNQSDGAFEITFDVDNNDSEQNEEALKFMKRLQRKNKKRQHMKKKRIAQVDGLYSSGEEDEDDVNIGSDDINSDLDDDEDSLNSDEENEDQEGNLMLCLYEKVARVKNKWKCNLRDGIANVNGKDYTFQKANGESEW
ncbi:hypothetical protein PACTADRAFT_5062 [Pachysolen tannophilus NRRL Y-2460]|uniref:Transcription initiation factor IIA large subunit n=1 Tax=Pachysolen tannophilus NRRL Y-2460 TaxID=669874 RepID=A0A1E4TNG9_PACTA|nr:hypothetical protein PACTADRAFT_5062 [Pachysolen tannophilus NRRL Y-2460]